MFAGLATNVVFGVIRMTVLVAAVSAAGPIAGYDTATSAVYVWLGQGLLAFVVLWGDTHLAERVRTGDVVVDLYRPWHLQAALFAEDVGRAGFAVLVRLVPPVALGALLFPFRWPDAVVLPLFAVSAVLALATSFAVRFLLNASTFWLLENRGLLSVYNVLTPVLCGLAVPLDFFPGWARDALWSTPFPAMIQAPIDVFLERGSPWAVLAHQAFWAAALAALGYFVLLRAMRKVVVQGG
ncbi:ABC-2 type transport system permease protein [Saccharothrix coeruleofusca]|uniref:ABC transporter permease n=1 Tax=Saccharothrix coeruleofusca TaxID=33919 RepID=UPI001FD58B10|nr:ABC-2 family transporter protein [Saccharothrix coeruleofusca]MBP2339262.1 ABC-2 type transport system permease protein [Saccharothrix coeruleofusca]